MSAGDPTTGGAATAPLVERLFRREYAQLVARTTRRLGAHRLSLAEDVAQEALVRALMVWPFEGIPRRPGAWLAMVAERAAIDHLRREGRQEGFDAIPEPASPAPVTNEDEDLLRLMLLCCHPSLPIESRLALVLKTACGFGNDEIAAGLLTTSEAVKRRLSRAHAILRDGSVDLECEGDERARRLDSLLLALYLLFNEGHSSAREEAHVRAELVDEALRLVRLVADDRRLAGPQVHALAALFCLQAARVEARLDEGGVPLSLAEQDRSRWDRALTAEGFVRLERSMSGERETRYHLEAAIAAAHAAAPSWGDTDWRHLLLLYDRLLRCHPSPVVALGRCVALAQVTGPRAGLAELDRIDASVELPLRTATRAQLLWLAGDLEAATDAFRRAIEEERSPSRRRFLERRWTACSSGGAPLDW
ncbi:RNA polymerase sigma factor [Engelhardtia mirabilis]|uniref:RNA polymerase sigma factor n=1 Tax=Engelhardtia mirabilis TaxID=2528011 RepID=A0A518BFL3_9BACT|nr:ECF RNA polymerase sigma factor SigE [Planctomycetes bacterium Pla133]QDV00094.1 ECF RNA polymerase sigma factor SigE [Planctomycetes bacterium Pla86]